MNVSALNPYALRGCAASGDQTDVPVSLFFLHINIIMQHTINNQRTVRSIQTKTNNFTYEIATKFTKIRESYAVLETALETLLQRLLNAVGVTVIQVSLLWLPSDVPIVMEWARTLHVTDTPCFTLTLKSYFRSFVVQIQWDADSAASDSSLTKCFVCLLERPIALRKAYVDLPTSPLASTSMAKRWTPYPLVSRSIVRSKYRSLFKALLRSILSSHETVNSTRMKESDAVDAITKSGRLPLSCSTLWQCLSPCRSAETSQSLALESKSLLCFSFFSLRCCDEPSLKKYILLAGAVSRAFAWEHAVLAASSTNCKTWLCSLV